MSERMTFGRAINRGLHRALADDPKVLLMGEDIGALGGVFRITDGLQAEFGEDRVLDTPLAESASWARPSAWSGSCASAPPACVPIHWWQWVQRCSSTWRCASMTCTAARRRHCMWSPM